MSRGAAVWESLVRDGVELATSEELAAKARRVGVEPAHVARLLRRNGRIVPLFKGYYYVRTPEEVRLGTARYNPLELFALAADAKDIGPWYFGLHTALRLNGMTHEHRREDTVIAERFYRPGVTVGGHRFVVHKWDPALLRFGLRRAGLVRHSDPEKTVLDYAYLDHWRARKRHPPTRTWLEHLPKVDARRLRGYLKRYPEDVREAVEAEL